MIDELVEKISADSGIEKSEILQLIEDKQVELSGLVSYEGAAYLVAKELGIMLKREQEKLNISSIVPGMQNIEITGKVVRVFPVREFKTEKAEGRVANIIIADNTGTIRLSLWNDEIEKISGVEAGDVVKIRGFVRDNMGNPEIRLGRNGHILKTDEKLDTVAVQEKHAGRSSLGELRENFYRSVRAPVVQVFESNIFYEICPECRARLKEKEDGFECEHHGKVEVDYGIVVSGIIDDGTASMRAVFFGEAAEKLLGMSKAEAKTLFDRKKKAEAVLSLIPLGKEFIFEGRVRRNDYFDRLEFMVNNVKNVDVKDEIELLMKG